MIVLRLIHIGMEEMQALQERLRKTGVLDAVLLAIAVVGMAVARYMWW